MQVSAQYLKQLCTAKYVDSSIIVTCTPVQFGTFNIQYMYMCILYVNVHVPLHTIADTQCTYTKHFRMYIVYTMYMYMFMHIHFIYMYMYNSNNKDVYWVQGCKGA